MKVVILLCLAAVALARPNPDDFYDTKYDNFNVDEIVENKRLLKSYAACFLGQGKCTPDGVNFKKWIPEAVQTSCGRCTEKQKILNAKVVKAIQTQLPEEWTKLKEIHDPENKRTDELNAYLEKYGS